MKQSPKYITNMVSLTKPSIIKNDRLEESTCANQLFNSGLAQTSQGIARIIGVFNFKTLLGPISDIKSILESQSPAIEKLKEILNSLTSFPEQKRINQEIANS